MAFHIFIANKNEQHRIPLKKLLENKGFQVSLIGSSPDFFAKIKQKFPHLILLDLDFARPKTDDSGQLVDLCDALYQSYPQNLILTNHMPIILIVIKKISNIKRFTAL